MTGEPVVLIISDHSNHRNILKIQTNLTFSRREASSEIIETETIGQAIHVLKERQIRPDLILIAAEAVKAEGQETFERVRSNGEDTITTVIFSERKELISVSVDTGSTLFLPLPLDLELFKHLIWAKFFSAQEANQYTGM